jgi:hypothetical protein
LSEQTPKVPASIAQFADAVANAAKEANISCSQTKVTLKHDCFDIKAADNSDFIIHYNSNDNTESLSIEQIKRHS